MSLSPSRKSAPPPGRAARLPGGFARPRPPGRRILGSGPSAPIDPGPVCCAGVAGAARDVRGVGGGRNPERVGRGRGAPRPGCALAKPSFPGNSACLSSDSNKSFMPVSTFSANFP